MADDANTAPVEENLLVDNDVNSDAGVHADGSDLAEAMMEDSSTSPDSSPEETTESTTEESGDKPVENEGETESEATADEEETPSDETSEESEEAVKQKNADARKEQLNREIREKVAERNQLRLEVAQLHEQKYRTQSVEELVEGGLSPEEARAEAQSQAVEMERYNMNVADLNSNLEIESTQVLADFPLFDPSAPEYNEEVATRATELYRQVSGVQTDPQTGLVTQANVLPYQFYKTLAETYTLAAQHGEQQGKLQGSRATEKMMAAVEPSSSTSAPQADPEEDDVFLKGFNKV